MDFDKSRNLESKMENILYVLGLEGGKYYVGKTSDVKRRFEQHMRGNGAEWTRMYKPVRIIETRSIASPHDENNVTKDLMKKHGIENVRGGAYTSVDMPEEQEDVLRHEMKSTVDTCYKCGKPGHFAKYCTKKSSFIGTCGCGKEFRVFEDFMSHQKMCLPRQEHEEEIWQCNHCDKEFDTERKAELHEQNCKFAKIARNVGRQKTATTRKPNACYRCGRTSHYADNCYASTHVRGYDLDD